MKPPLKQVSLFNPLMKDFEYEFFDDNNAKHLINLPSMTVTTMPEPLANFMAKHLADEIMNGITVKTNYDDERAKVLETIYVK